jgi:hypothetical protein
MPRRVTLGAARLGTDQPPIHPIRFFEAFQKATPSLARRFWEQPPKSRAGFFNPRQLERILTAREK